MDKYLQENLLDGEKVLWTGRSEQFKVLSGPYRKKAPAVWAVSALIVLGFAAWFLPIAAKSGTSVTQMIFCLVIVGAVPASASLHVWSDARIIQKQMEYALTNCRAISMSKSGVNAMTVDEHTDWRTETLEDGTEVLYIGDACRTKASKSREHAVLGIRSDSKSPAKLTGLVFYGVKNAQDVCEAHAVFAKRAGHQAA